jgi:hypothetical protein
MTGQDFEAENERFLIFIEGWLDEQFEWAAAQKRLHPDDGPWRRGTRSAEERLMDALHYLQHALTICGGCREDYRALCVEVVELLRGIPGASARLKRAREELARGEGIPLRELDEPGAE